MVAGMFLARCLHPAVREVHTVPLDLLNRRETAVALDSEDGKADEEGAIKIPESAKLPSSASRGVAPASALRCRICWDEGDESKGGRLVSPCKCTGSVVRSFPAALEPCSKFLSHAYSWCDVRPFLCAGNGETRRVRPTLAHQIPSMPCCPSAPPPPPPLPL